MRTACSLLLLLLASLSLARAFLLPREHRQPLQVAATPRSRSRAVTQMAVSAPKGSYDITLLPGDGIGPEIMGATVRLRACVLCCVGVVIVVVCLRVSRLAETGRGCGGGSKTTTHPTC